MRRPALLLLAAMLALPVQARAQTPADTTVTPAEMAVARELMVAMRLPQTSSAGVTVMMDAQIRMNPELAPYRSVMVSWANQLFATEEAMDGFARLYAARFTEDELRGLLAFYNSPLGQRLAEASAPMALESAAMGKRLAEAHQSELIARLSKVAP